MDKFLSQFSKATLAFVAIAGGILLIVLFQPPASVCDSQIEVIKKSQDAFLYRDPKYPKAKSLKTSRYEYLYDVCKATNSPGGCYELFQEVKVLIHDLGTLTVECAPAVGGLKEIKRVLWDTMNLLVDIAWGTQAPGSYQEKFGWLDKADISLYCQLKGKLQTIYGDSAWESYREKKMRELPGTKELTRNQVWDVVLFSENCARYP